MVSSQYDPIAIIKSGVIPRLADSPYNKIIGQSTNAPKYLLSFGLLMGPNSESEQI